MNRPEIHARIQKEYRKEINDYLDKQENISKTLQLALLIVKKAYGNQDLQAALNKNLISNLDLKNLKSVEDKEEAIQASTSVKNTHKDIPVNSENNSEPLDPSMVKMLLNNDGL